MISIADDDAQLDCYHYPRSGSFNTRMFVQIPFSLYVVSLFVLCIPCTQNHKQDLKGEERTGEAPHRHETIGYIFLVHSRSL